MPVRKLTALRNNSNKNLSFQLKKIKIQDKLQLTFAPHRFGLHKSTYMPVFSAHTLGNFLEVCDNLKKLTDEPHSLEILKKIKKKVMS